jgi:hypothetical protein
MTLICENCGKEHDGSYGSGRFCSKECARAFSTKNSKGQLKEAKCIDCGKIIYIGKRASDKKCRCEECNKKYNELKFVNFRKNKYKILSKNLPKINSNCNLFNIKCENCYFKQHNICKSKSGINYKLQTLQKYCGLKISNYENTLNEYLEIKYSIQQMINHGLSGVDICLQLCGSSKRGNTLYNILEISVRNLSESVANAFVIGKMDAKSGYHITWNNKEVYLRSSYELDYAKELDKQQIDYEVEYLHIKYWDSQLHKYRCAIPDFYIPSTNTIVEIKSSWTYDKQNMIDKKKSYIENGYNFQLYLEHKLEII